MLMSSALATLLWGLGAFFAALGLLAMISPPRFAALARFGSHWIDTSHLLSKLDRRVDLDDKLLPYSRFLGASVVAAMGMLWFTFHR